MKPRIPHICARATTPLREVRAAAFAAILAAACSSYGTSANNASTQPRKPATRPSSPGPQALTVFEGAWSGHGSGILILPDGRFILSMRTYQWCGQAPAPCDSFSGNEIINGDKATGHLTSVSGEVATGVVTHTTDPALTPAGQIKIILDPATDTITADNTIFCGPSAPASNCGA